MQDRDSIVRKINALNAIANDGAASLNEVEVAIRKRDKLMEEYNLTFSDLEIKNSKVNEQPIRTGAKKHLPEMHNVVNVIAKLTETEVVHFSGGSEHVYVFYGLRVDTEYAEWIYRLVLNSLEQAWKAFKFSAKYTDLVKYQGIHGRVVRANFRNAFILLIKEKLQAMVLDKQTVSTNALVLIKKDLIKVEIDKLNTTGKTSNRAIGFSKIAPEAIAAGLEEANKVVLRQQTNRQPTLFLEGK